MQDENYPIHPDLASTAMPAIQEEIAPVEQQVAQQEQAPLLEAQQPEQKEDHPNFRSLRDKAEKERERADRERERADRLELELRRNTQPQQQQAQEREEYLSDDDFATGKHISKFKKQQDKELHDMRQEIARTKQQMTDSMLRATYSDIGKVMTPDNVRKLAEMEPEIAQGLNNITDYASQVQATYKMIKKLGIVVEDNFEKDRARVQTNVAKPKTSNSISPQQGESPLSRANVFANHEDMSEEACQKRYAETMKYASERR